MTGTAIPGVARMPFFLVIMAIGAAAMLVPAAHAYQARDLDVARPFFYGAAFFGVVVLMLHLAVGAVRVRHPERAHLTSYAAAFVALPLMLAVPFWEAAGNVRFGDAWFEMISCLTTTGATVFDGQGRLADSLHLWRGLVGWMGGFLIWVAAMAVLAPLNLGGFEVVATGRDPLEANAARLRIGREGHTAERLLRFSRQLGPVYAALSLVLWLGLIATGMPPFDGALRAMSIIATSGIDGDPGPAPGLATELPAALFLVLALSRMTYSDGGAGRGSRLLRADPELRLALIIIGLVTALLFARHWLAGDGPSGATEGADPVSVMAALWGAAFTALSFLATLGTESVAFDATRTWTGLPTPGILLVGLALVGGGVATTAGGVKLLRMYALYRHGAREMGRLVHPSSIGSAGVTGRRLRREGAFVAWIFFMLFAVSIAAVMALLALTGIDFDDAVVLTVAALSTTGPLAQAAADPPLLYSSLNDPARVVLAAAMLLGRLEALALIALFNPAFWRD